MGDDKVIHNIASHVDISNHNDSYYYGLKGNETTYFCNSVDGLYKVSNTFLKTTVLANPVDSICYSNISGRNFTAEGHRSSFSNVQNQTAIDTSNLETYGANSWILINPTEGEKIFKVIDNGEITFFLKDTGIWALINANEDPTKWIVPKCNADIGTKSPWTVKYSRYGQNEGFIYLATDKTLRFFSASVQRNAGVLPTLVGGDSKIISKPFQKLLNDIPSDMLNKCKAGYFGRYYILCVPTLSSPSLSLAIVVDTDKLMQTAEADIPQPYWFLSDVNLCKNDFVVQDSRLYGFSPDGYISQMFVDDIYYDEMPQRLNGNTASTVAPFDSVVYLSISGIVGDYDIGSTVSEGTATGIVQDASTYYVIAKNTVNQFHVGQLLIETAGTKQATITDVKRRVAIQYGVYTGWYKFSESELLLYDVYVNWKALGYWPLYMSVNSFVKGESIPDFDTGRIVALYPDNAKGNTNAFANVEFVSNKAQLSQNYGQEIRGNYFNFGFYNNACGQPATLYSLEPLFKQSKTGPMGSNK